MGEKTINFKPTFNYILTTCNMKKVDTKVILPKNYRPEINLIQQVVAVGPRVEEDQTVKVGDWVMFSQERFTRTVKRKSSIRAGVGGQEMIEEVVDMPFFEIPGVDDLFLKMTDREIDGIIPDFNQLPEEYKNYMSAAEFAKTQTELAKNDSN